MNARAWFFAAALCAGAHVAHANPDDDWIEIDLGGGKSFVTAPASARIDSAGDGYTSTLSVRTDDWGAVFQFVDHPVRTLDKFKRDARIKPDQVVVSETLADGWLLISRDKKGAFHVDLAHRKPFYYCNGTALRTREQADAVARVCKSLRHAPDPDPDAGVQTEPLSVAGRRLCRRIAAGKGLPRGMTYWRQPDVGAATPTSRREVTRRLTRIRGCKPSAVRDAAKLGEGSGWYFDPTEGLEDDAIAYVASGKWVLKFFFVDVDGEWRPRRAVLWLAN